jgi:hypothetical protein
MKALHVTIRPDNTLQILPLALPSAQRRGVAAPDAYRRLAAGEIEKKSFSPHWADSLRAIRLSDGAFDKLASGPGALLTFILSGDVTLLAGASPYERLVAGDIFLTDEKSASSITLDSRNDAMLLQFGVAPDWPGPAAEIQLPGTIQQRPGSQPKFLRILNGDDDKAYFTEFPELFSSPHNQWSSPRPLAGFRMLYWENGEMDWHPSVVNQFGIVLSGELQVDVGGRGGATESFHAGDVCLSEDRTGQGHIGRSIGGVHVTNLIIDTEHLWS